MLGAAEGKVHTLQLLMDLLDLFLNLFIFIAKVNTVETSNHIIG